MERPSTKHLIKAFESGGAQGKKLHVLIVYAHQEPKSFNGALKDVAVEVLRELGHTVEISDLYAQNFNPLCTRNDIKGELLNPNHFKYCQETQNAYKNGTLSEDIVSEQEKLNRADLVIFQFPIYWMSFPAILKGWFDRVFTLGYAFTYEAMCDEGLLKGKRAMLSFTTGGRETAFTTTGIMGDMEVMLWPIQFGVLHFCGLEVLAPNIVSPDYLDQSQREALLQEWATRLRHINQEKPLDFLHLDCFSASKGFQLSDEFLQSKRATGDVAPTVGQHMGKRFAVGSMIPQRLNTKD
ncbi:ribosyldihydronicotinamide dehydrogenase [quinone] [Lingula anatina]|uniref:Ribosyldihydronicotinamide dehydrogenase [quinone] n=1 Tax=Lingula anatina TaxID=7574 RepID=A0A1S3K5X3_LINAN|nr:ribosyldihydronicotinamide dehydrogenase [quinone] [Lingula anatina]|eukprot:XP_013417651.1 ribosyldihydronicotinamide dehydrogenase [quinone] [Lingula anatina]